MISIEGGKGVNLCKPYDFTQIMKRNDCATGVNEKKTSDSKVKYSIFSPKHEYIRAHIFTNMAYATS